MSVLLIDIDSKIPNLALMKVSAYYKSQGIPVGFDIDVPDKAYISVIFAHNRAYGRSAATMLKALYPGIEIDIGGPGYDLHKVLPDCIESMQPDYSLYPEIDYAMGFTTRGCIRKCPFCIVPVKEGKLKHIQPIESIYRPEFDAIKLLDNNVMADRDNFKHIVDFCEMHELKLYKAIMNTFGKSYEYTARYYRFRAEREQEIARQVRKTPSLDCYGGMC